MARPSEKYDVILEKPDNISLPIVGPAYTASRQGTDRKAL